MSCLVGIMQPMQNVVNRLALGGMYVEAVIDDSFAGHAERATGLHFDGQWLPSAG